MTCFIFFGSNERHLRLMEEELDVVIHARTEIVQVLGEEAGLWGSPSGYPGIDGFGESWNDRWHTRCGDCD